MIKRYLLVLFTTKLFAVHIELKKFNTFVVCVSCTVHAELCMGWGFNICSCTLTCHFNKNTLLTALFMQFPNQHIMYQRHKAQNHADMDQEDNLTVALNIGGIKTNMMTLSVA